MSLYIAHADYLLYSVSKISNFIKENDEDALIVTIPTSSSVAHDGGYANAASFVNHVGESPTDLKKSIRKMSTIGANSILPSEWVHTPNKGKNGELYAGYVH